VLHGDVCNRKDTSTCLAGLILRCVTVYQLSLAIPVGVGTMTVKVTIIAREEKVMRITVGAVTRSTVGMLVKGAGC